MNCKKVGTLLSRHLDGELKEAERQSVAEHLHGCAHCSRIVEDYQTLGQLLKLTEQRTMKPFLWSRIAAEIGGSGRQQPWIAQIRTPWLGWAAALVCTVLLIGCLFFIGLKIIPGDGDLVGATQGDQSGSTTAGQTELSPPGFVSNPGPFSKESVLANILSDNDEASNNK